MHVTKVRCICYADPRRAWIFTIYMFPILSPIDFVARRSSVNSQMSLWIWAVFSISFRLLFPMAQQFSINLSRVDLFPVVQNNNKIQVCHEQPPAA